MINAGELNHRIEIQSATETTNEAGGNVQTWATLNTRWASIKPLAGRELFNAQQVKADVTHKICLRYHETLTPHMRFKFGSRIFNIASAINPDSQRVEHECLCKEEI